jgi:ornithine carbamoyltransferase
MRLGTLWQGHESVWTNRTQLLNAANKIMDGACAMSALEKIAFATQWQGLLGRNLITLDELTGREIIEIVDEAMLLKDLRRRGVASRKSLADRHVALIFLRPSFRTRCAFAIAAGDSGAQSHLLDPAEIRFGTKESYRDIARVLSRMFSLVVIRCMETETLFELDRHLEIPVWNAMTDQDHPTQVIADVMTLIENGINPAGAKMTFIGHGRGNVCSSLMKMAMKIGLHLMVVTPPGLEPDPYFLSGLRLKSEHPLAAVQVTNDVALGVRGADAIYADTWSNTDQPTADIEAEVEPFQPYRVTPQLMQMTGKDSTIFLHCMPSFHSLDTSYTRLHPTSLDTSDEVFEGPRSRVIDEAENRLHVIKALMKNAL